MIGYMRIKKTIESRKERVMPVISPRKPSGFLASERIVDGY